MSKMKELGMSLDEAIEAGEGLVSSLKEAIHYVEIILGSAKDIKEMFGGKPEVKAAAIPEKKSEALPAAKPAAETEKKPIPKKKAARYSRKNPAMDTASRSRPFLRNTVLKT